MNVLSIIVFMDSQLSVLDAVQQRFSNFFQVGTTFISQNVLRTTLLIRPALNSVQNMFLQQKIPLLLLRVE